MWALTSAVSCSRSARRNGRTRTVDMADLHRDGAVGRGEPPGGRYRCGTPPTVPADGRPGWSGAGVGAGVEQAQVGPAGGQDGVDLVGGGEVAADHGRD